MLRVSIMVCLIHFASVLPADSVLSGNGNLDKGTGLGWKEASAMRRKYENHSWGGVNGPSAEVSSPKEPQQLSVDSDVAISSSAIDVSVTSTSSWEVPSSSVDPVPIVSSSTTLQTSLSSTSSSVMAEPSQATINVKSSFVTQEALPVRDNSFSALSNLQRLMSSNDYSVIFDKKFVSAASNLDSISSLLKGTMAEQNLDDNLYIEAISGKGGHPFLYTGAGKSRTKQNCYMVRMKEDLNNDLRSKIKDVLKVLGAEIKYDYEAHGLHGVSACFPDKELPLSLLRTLSPIAWIERDQFSRVHFVQNEAPWQLPRLNNPKSDLIGGQYIFNATGKGVNVYTIDSGIMLDHPEFGGRAKIGFSIFGASEFPNDCAGHGTQVASVIAGTNVGVAKLANVICAQVLDCEGQGENSSVLAALNWIVANHVKPAVINMSVGGPKSPSVDAAVQAAVGLGIGVVVAAGNSMIDACTLSPSGVDVAMVVGASTVDLERADFSNYGSCVDLFAPGRHIIAAALPSQSTKNGFTFVSGTSLSAPLVTGLYALLLENNPGASPAELKNAVMEASVTGLIKERTLMGSPNILAQAPTIQQTTDINIQFLPPGILPVFGAPSEGPSTTEIALIAIAGVVAVLFFIAALILFIRKRKERKLELETKYRTAFQ